MTRLSWEETEKIAEELADKIKKSGFKPDYLMGVTTGGLIPLAWLAKGLKVNQILTVSARSHGEGAKKRVTLAYLPKIDLSGCKVLLVDEIAETGVTLKRIAAAVASQSKAKEIKTAALGANQDRCLFWPDFFVVTEQGDWIIFPWEKENFSKYC